MFFHPGFDVGGYIKEHRLEIPFWRSFDDAKRHLSEEQAHLSPAMRVMTEKFAHDMLAAIEKDAPVIGEDVAYESVHINRLLSLPDVQAIEGNRGEKIVLLYKILTFVSEQIANVVWHHEKNETIEESMKKEDPDDQNANMAVESFGQEVGESNTPEDVELVLPANLAVREWTQLFRTICRDMGLELDDEDVQ